MLKATTSFSTSRSSPHFGAHVYMETSTLPHVRPKEAPTAACVSACGREYMRTRVHADAIEYICGANGECDKRRRPSCKGRGQGTRPEHTVGTQDMRARAVGQRARGHRIRMRRTTRDDTTERGHEAKPTQGKSQEHERVHETSQPRERSHGVKGQS